MHWYVIRLVYQIVNSSTSEQQFDEQVRLIQADCMEWAVEKAATLGRLGEEFFYNQQQTAVQWKFIGVTDVIPVDSIEDGVQLFSETQSVGAHDNYFDIVIARFTRLTTTFMESKLQLN
jgi:hypothetical protein